MFLYAVLVQMSLTIDGFRNKFIKFNKAFNSKSLKTNFGKTKVIVSGDITKDGFLKTKLTHVGSAA